MELATFLPVVIILALVIALLHQWVLDSPLLELGEAAWFPTSSDISAATAIGRSLLAALIPLAGTVLAAILVFKTSFQDWVWGLVVILTMTVLLSPALAVYRYDVRLPTPEEALTPAAIASAATSFGARLLTGDVQ